MNVIIARVPALIKLFPLMVLRLKLLMVKLTRTEVLKFFLSVFGQRWLLQAQDLLVVFGDTYAAVMVHAEKTFIKLRKIR